MRFVRVARGEFAPRGLRAPYVTLQVNNWDDYGYKTMFDSTLHSRTAVYRLGNVKILQADQRDGYTPIQDRFDALDQDYCSAGQDSTYYETVAQIPLPLRDEYLIAIRDAAFDPRIEDRFSRLDGWRNSLFRFGQADNALEVGKQLLREEQPRKTRGVLSFAFHWQRGETPLDVAFNFDDSQFLPGRCNALIGYNGVGKTTLLADLAVAASKVGFDTRTSDRTGLFGADTSFGSVIAVSYSAFDTFVTPDVRREGASSTALFGYVYCGLRMIDNDADSPPPDDAHGPLVDDADSPRVDSRPPRQFALKSIDEVELEFASALRTAGTRVELERQYFLSALGELAKEPSFARAGVDLNSLSRGAGSDDVVADFRQLSTGHKIVVNIVTQLAAHLRQRSLVLVDEPETHLHPPLMAALLRAIQSLLLAYDSFAVVATHSPVVVQEIPSKYIRILERVGDEVTLRSPTVETFGEAIGTITRHVFSLDSSATDYQSVLARLATELPVPVIESLFEHGLATQARAMILNYLAERQ